MEILDLLPNEIVEYIGTYTNEYHKAKNEKQIRLYEAIKTPRNTEFIYGQIIGLIQNVSVQFLYNYERIEKCKWCNKICQFQVLDSPINMFYIDIKKHTCQHNCLKAKHYHHFKDCLFLIINKSNPWIDIHFYNRHRQYNIYDKLLYKKLLRYMRQKGFKMKSLNHIVNVFHRGDVIRQIQNNNYSINI